MPGASSPLRSPRARRMAEVSNGKVRFTQADLRRALRVAEQAGRPSMVEVTTEGNIRIVPIEPADPLHPRNPQGKPIEREGRVLF